MRIAAIDLGSNSTRLLIADAESGRLSPVLSISRVTRMGEDVDRSGRFTTAALERVHATLTDYRIELARHRVQRTVGLLTSAARDAADGADIALDLNARYGIEARVLSGYEEARLAFIGALAGASDQVIDADSDVAVIDVGGGSTEIAIGRADDIRAYTSIQVGVVRHSERFLHADPPTATQLAALRSEARKLIVAATMATGIADQRRLKTTLALGGTPASCAAMLGHRQVHGRWVTADQCERMLTQVAVLPTSARERLPGLHPDRAPAIVAGLTLQIEALIAIGADGFYVSEHDLRHGALIALSRSLTQS